MKNLFLYFVIFCASANALAQKYPVFKDGKSATPQEWDQNTLTRDGGAIFWFPTFTADQDVERILYIHEEMPIKGFDGRNPSSIEETYWSKSDLPQNVSTYYIKSNGELSWVGFTRPRYKGEFSYDRVFLHEDGTYRQWKWYSSSCGNFFPSKVVAEWPAEDRPVARKSSNIDTTITATTAGGPISINIDIKNENVNANTGQPAQQQPVGLYGQQYQRPVYSQPVYQQQPMYAGYQQQQYPQSMYVDKSWYLNLAGLFSGNVFGQPTYQQPVYQTPRRYTPRYYTPPPPTPPVNYGGHGTGGYTGGVAYGGHGTGGLYGGHGTGYQQGRYGSHGTGF